MIMSGLPTSTPPFNKGDKVKVKSNLESGGFSAGTILTVKECTYTTAFKPNWMVRFDEGGYYNYYHELELYKEPNSSTKPHFKIGDRVRIIKNQHGGNGVGNILMIQSFKNTMDGSEMVYFYGTTLWNTLDELELVAESGMESTYNTASTFSYPYWTYGDESIKIKKNKTMSITQKFRNLFRTEPFKTLNKVGLTDSENELTSEGQNIFLNWLLVKHAEEFKTEVGEKLVEETK